MKISTHKNELKPILLPIGSGASSLAFHPLKRIALQPLCHQNSNTSLTESIWQFQRKPTPKTNEKCIRNPFGHSYKSKFKKILKMDDKKT